MDYFRSLKMSTHLRQPLLFCQIAVFIPNGYGNIISFRHSKTRIKRARMEKDSFLNEIKQIIMYLLIFFQRNNIIIQRTIFLL